MFCKDKQFFKKNKTQMLKHSDFADFETIIADFETQNLP